MIVYIFDDLANADTGKILNLIEKMPSDRVVQAHKYIHIKDKVICVLSFLLLAYGLKEAGIKKEDIDFIYGNNEKPYLKEEAVFFNISHADDKIICCISERECGADIEKIKPLKDDLMKRVCSIDEINMIICADNKEAAFTRLWTVKESYIKFKGASIGMDLKKIDSLMKDEDVYVQSFEYKEYMISVCSAAKTEIEQKYININELLN